MSLFAYTSESGQVMLNGNITDVDMTTVYKLPHGNYLAVIIWESEEPLLEKAFANVQSVTFSSKEDLIDYLNDALPDSEALPFFNQSW